MILLTPRKIFGSGIRRFLLVFLVVPIVVPVFLGAIASSAAWDSLAIAAVDPAADTAWVAVARSEQGIQYVAPGSIQVTAGGVRLKSYWQPPTDGGLETVYYVTEYDCQGRYRDVEATNGVKGPSQKDTNWKSIGADPLNRGAMEYGCARQGGN